MFVKKYIIYKNTMPIGGSKKNIYILQYLQYVYIAISANGEDNITEGSSVGLDPTSAYDL